MPVNKPIRVLQIVSGFAVEGPLGGLERFGIELSRNLNPQRFDNTLVGLWSFDQPTESTWMDLASDNGSIAWMGPSYDFVHPYRSFMELYRAFVAHFHEQRFDVIHSHCQFGDVLALFTARRLGAKSLVRTVHNEVEWGRRFARRILLTNLLYPLVFQAEVGVSQQVVDNLNSRKAAAILKREAQLMYNAVDLSRFQRPEHIRDLRKEYGIPVNAFLVGSVGRLAEQKGLCDLVSAASLVLKQNPDVYFMIVGDGELRPELEAQIRELGIGDRVILTGILTGIEEVLWNWDLFVSSSWWEGLPTVLLESMAAGLPIVATDVSGTRELIQHERNGILVPSRNYHTLADAILRMADTPDLSSELIKQANETVAQFSIKYVTQQYENLYASLFAGC